MTPHITRYRQMEKKSQTLESSNKHHISWSLEPLGIYGGHVCENLQGFNRTAHCQLPTSYHSFIVRNCPSSYPRRVWPTSKTCSPTWKKTRANWASPASGPPWPPWRKSSSSKNGMMLCIAGSMFVFAWWVYHIYPSVYSGFVETLDTHRE